MHLFTLPLRLALLAAVACLVPHKPVEAAHYELFVLSGQSNMNGLVPNASLPAASHLGYADGDFLYSSSSVSSSHDFGNLQGGTISGGWGPEIGFAHDLFNCGVANAAFVKHAVNGSLIDSWQPGATDYDLLTERAFAAIDDLVVAGHTVSVAGFFWLQGESDNNGGTSYNDYFADLQNLHTGLYGDLATAYGSNSNVSLSNRFFMVEPAYTNGNEAGGEPVDDAMEAYAAASSDAYFVGTDDLHGYLDWIHFDDTSQLEIGSRMATAYHEAVPEPSASFLAMIALVLIGNVRRRR